jgi:hypothetical protein
MTIAQTYSYRHAEAILRAGFPGEEAEIRTALTAAAWSVIPVRTRVRGGKTVLSKDIHQDQSNKNIEAQFKAIGGWAVRPLIVSATDSKLRSDFKKGRVQVEVQFGNMARWYTDAFKFLLSYSVGDIEVGVLVVPMQATARRIDENVASYERVVRELPHAKMGITLPIWVIGLS